MKLLLLSLAFLAPSIVGDAQSRTSAAGAVQSAFVPGPQHELLQKLAGNWDAVLVAADGQRTKGTLTIARHTGFHTLESFEGEFMGRKFEGHGVHGYCTVRKQYFTFWTDSMTSSPMVLYGDYDAGKRELTMTGECYGSSGKLESCKSVTRCRDDDHFTWALFGSAPDGREVQLLGIEYTRKR